MTQSSFVEISSKHCLSKTLRAKENVQPPPRVWCHITGARCQVSGVTCHMYCVYYIYIVFFLQCCVASQWRVCYQWGLPRLVFCLTRLTIHIFQVWLFLCLCLCLSQNQYQNPKLPWLEPIWAWLWSVSQDRGGLCHRRQKGQKRGLPLDRKDKRVTILIISYI